MKPSGDEIELETFYGRLVAKVWNEETPDCKRILALHGWMDNAGSFDKLLKELTYDQELYVVALDLPGHGRSSQLIDGCFYSDHLMITEIRKLLLHLGWINSSDNTTNEDQESSLHSTNSYDNIQALAENDHDEGERKFTIIGHSYGGFLAMCYASVFPLEVKSLILLDFIKTKSVSYEEMLSEAADALDILMKRTPKRRLMPEAGKIANHEHQIDCGQVVVTQESAIIATAEAHKKLGNLSRDETLCLLKRCTIPVTVPANSVIYYRDLRLKYVYTMRDNLETNKLLFAGIKCNVFVTLCKRGLYSRNRFKVDMDKVVDFVKSKAKLFDLVWVDEDHFFHMNNSKEAAKLVVKYLELEDKEIA